MVRHVAGPMRGPAPLTEGAPHGTHRPPHLQRLRPGQRRHRLPLPPLRQGRLRLHHPGRGGRPGRRPARPRGPAPPHQGGAGADHLPDLPRLPGKPLLTSPPRRPPSLEGGRRRLMRQRSSPGPARHLRSRGDAHTGAAPPGPPMVAAWADPSTRRRRRRAGGPARPARPGRPGANASASAGRPGTCRGDVLPAAAAASARGAGGRGSGACPRRGRWVDSDFRGRWALWRLMPGRMGGGCRRVDRRQAESRGFPVGG